MSEGFDAYFVCRSIMDEGWQKELSYQFLEAVEPGMLWRLTYRRHVDLHHRKISRLETCKGFNIRISCINATRRQVEAYCDMRGGTIIQSVEECQEDLFG